MQDFTMALIQHKSPLGRARDNLRATIRWARKAKEAEARLVCFPELNITGHAGTPEMVREAEPVPGGHAVERLCALAEELGITISAGIAEDDRGIHYNTQFVVGPEGYIGKQRKVHLSGDEYFYFRHGTALPVFDLPMARMGMIICYDNLVPEIARCLAVKGAELLFCPHAARFGKWPKDYRRIEAEVTRNKENWRMIHACRAYDNGCYVALCNTAGRSATRIKGVRANHAGGCMVFDPNGRLIAESQRKDIGEEMVLVSLNGEAVASRRRQTCFNLQTRRPEVFTVLTRPTA